jgi:hypothetical protein
MLGKYSSQTIRGQKSLNLALAVVFFYINNFVILFFLPVRNHPKPDNRQYSRKGQYQKPKPKAGEILGRVYIDEVGKERRTDTNDPHPFVINLIPGEHAEGK